MSTTQQQRGSRTRARILAAGAMLAALVAGCAYAPGENSARHLRPDASVSPAAGSATATDAVRAGLGGLPVSFVANQGRWDPRAAWVASGSEATAYFLDGGVRWALTPAQGAARALAGEEAGFALDQILVGARDAAPTASVAAPGVVSYFGGEASHAGLATASELTLEQAWPGVDVVWSGTGGHIEATYHLAPGADPAQVRVAWQGAGSVDVTAEGRLEITTPVRSFEEDAPKAFQDIDGTRVPVEVAYDLDDAGTYGFRLGGYDPARPLVIDPTVLVYAGFLGGGGDERGTAIAVDGVGNAYVTGSTDSAAATFPETTGVFQAASGGGGNDAFVAKVNLTGSALVYASFLGGSGTDAGNSIAVDGAGNAYVTGSTTSAAGTFPETPGVFQTANRGHSDAFVAKVNPTGSALVYASFLGGVGEDIGNGIAVDGAGHAYVTGWTNGTSGFPVTSGVFQAARGSLVNRDAFVAKVNPTGSALAYASFLGGALNDSGQGIAVDAAGYAYVIGSTNSQGDFPMTSGVFQPSNRGATDAFVAKVNQTGSALVYASFLGGVGDDFGLGIALDGDLNAYVTGQTSSAAETFPETPGVFQAANAGGSRDAFAAKVNQTGSALVYAGFLGGSGDDTGYGIAVDGARNAYVTGYTTSADFPVTSGAFQATNGGGLVDAFVAKVGPTGSALAYAGFLGGSGDDIGHGIAVDVAGHAYVTGQTTSAAATFPETTGVFQATNRGGTDAFVAKITVAPTISDISDRSINEDGRTDANFTIGDVETPAASLVVTKASSNTALVPLDRITFLNAGTTVRVTPVPNGFGEVTITLTVTDASGASASDSFTVTVRPVNDAPTFTAGPSPSVDEDAGPQSVANWVAAVSAVEAGQTLSYLVTANTNPALFSAGPAISPAGTLTYTPAANANGVATITAVARDSGGTANGGADTSAPQNFTITVRAINDTPTVSAIAGQSTFSNVALAGVAVSVGDVETPAASLGVSASSSNPAVVADAGIVVAGTGSSRNLQVTPVAGASGTTTITVTVTDAGGASASSSFVLTVVADTTPVACKITFVGGTPRRVEVTATDAGSGLARIEVTTAVNIVVPVTMSPADWAVGTTSPVVITATKVDQTKPAQVAYVVTDRSGNRSSCDPVFLDVDREPGKPVTTTVGGVPAVEHLVTVTNASPGITTLKIEVNGVRFDPLTLTDAQVVTVDVARAMRPGDDNTFAFTVTGKPGGTAGVLIHD
jgi:hypothetical protein